jgi:hypothetical protein
MRSPLVQRQQSSRRASQLCLPHGINASGSLTVHESIRTSSIAIPRCTAYIDRFFAYKPSAYRRIIEGHEGQPIFQPCCQPLYLPAISLSTMSDYVWDTFVTYRLNQVDLESFLKQTFGDDLEFYVSVCSWNRETDHVGLKSIG